ncbi:zinc ABC transporter substrate-binding protein [Zoogloea sp.]|uniref:metal ABC transporter substrate-binding protein n=1 Tax=Zoogloea sp. TaxID=49181 RepID=UPI002632ED05|nr:zinc ABC transporter substrate-binding protein [Zoogloea sp.]
MIKLIRRLFVLALALGAWPAVAALNVFATVPEWAALAKEIGGESVQVFSATTALQDPHRIEARPSLIARARSSQLVLATGADLEIGWLPLVLRESGNSALQPGRPGYFEATAAVRMLEVPVRVDRADGDVHAAGNPHIQTDPRNLLKVAEALAARLVQLDVAHASTYQANLASFSARWKTALTRWEQAAAPLRGMPVWVQHRSFPYLSDWLGLKELGALEPKPGVEPGSAQLAGILERQKGTPAKMVLRPAYSRPTSSAWLAERAGIPVVVLPFTVGGTPEAGDLFALFDDTVRRLLAAAR